MREPSAELARDFFTWLGFQVEDIPTIDGQKRADLRAVLDGEEHVLEAKERLPHFEWRAAMQQAEAQGYAITTRAIEPWQTLSNTILKAHAQLVATPAGSDAFRILCIFAPHSDDDFVISCVEKRLIGVQLLMAYRSLREPPEPIDCYYYDENDFERCPGIDAALLFARDGARLLINHYSANRERFLTSYLCTTLMAKAERAVIDAVSETQAGRGFMLDKDFSGPREGNAQWTYLRDKHGVLTSRVMESYFKSVLIVPASALRPSTAELQSERASPSGNVNTGGASANPPEDDDGSEEPLR